MKGSPFLMAACLAALACVLPSCNADKNSGAQGADGKEAAAPAAADLSPYDIATADAVLDEPVTQPIPDSKLAPAHG